MAQVVAMAEQVLVPRVGVGVLVCKGKQVLVGKRRSSVGGGKYALPGGFLDFGESWEECAAREVMEETGLAIHNLRFAHVTNTIMRDERRPSHSVSIFMRSDLADRNAEPRNAEPEKCEGWEWVEWPHVPQPQFQPLQSLIASGYQITEQDQNAKKGQYVYLWEGTVQWGDICSIANFTRLFHYMNTAASGSEVVL